MLRKFVSLFVLLPLAIVLIAFTVANRAMVVVSLDPFSPQQPALALEMPLFVLVFLSLLAGVIAGGVATWLGQGRLAQAGPRQQERGSQGAARGGGPARRGRGRQAWARRGRRPHRIARAAAARLEPILPRTGKRHANPGIGGNRGRHFPPRHDRGDAQRLPRPYCRAAAPALPCRAPGPPRQRHRHLSGMDRFSRRRPFGPRLPGRQDHDRHAGQPAEGLPERIGTYLLLSGKTGVPLAMIDGRVLTYWRTAATCALASSYLARADSGRLLMLGAGGLAPYLIEAHAAVRPLNEVLIWNRTPEAADRLAAALRRSGLRVSATRDLEGAVRGADIVSCAADVDEPLVRAAWIAPGTHLDLAGGRNANACGVDADTLALARLVHRQPRGTGAARRR